MPENILYKYFRIKRIKCNKKKCLPNYILKENDLIELYINDEFFSVINNSNYNNQNAPFDIIYEDENIMIINKPQGLISHCANGEKSDNLIDSIINYLIKNKDFKISTFIPVLCNRLDKNTSGLCICAKNSLSAREINQMIANNQLTKSYLTVCKGFFEEKAGKYTAYWEKDSKNNVVIISNNMTQKSKKIITGIEVLSEKKDLSLLKINLITGRSHQIRAHLAFLNHPILGDYKYGESKINIEYNEKYQLLKAFQIDFGELKFDEYKLLSYLSDKTFKLNKCNFVEKYFNDIII